MSHLTKETFVGDAIIPEDMSFSAPTMATGAPGLPAGFIWKGRKFSVVELLEAGKKP